jgi:hypothetical protein
LGEFGEEAGADGVEGGGGGLGGEDDFDVEHEIIRALTNKVVKSGM